MAEFLNSFVATNHHATYPSIDETSNELSCRGKVVFITGGGRGIGQAIAKAFATAKADAIFLIGRSEEALQESAKQIGVPGQTKVKYAVADIMDAHAVSAAMNQAIAAFSRIDVLVQNAGYLNDHRAVVDSDLEDYWRTFEINVKGGLNVIQSFLKSHPPIGATIINVGSGAGHISYIPSYSAYSASKLGFAKIVEYVQHENQHLRVFSINPGAIATDMGKKNVDLVAIDDIGTLILISSMPQTHN